MKVSDRIFPAVPLRWQTSLVLMISVFIGYLDRLNITLALPKLAKDFGWTIQETGDKGGLLMSIFYVSYGMANILLSPLGEKIGPRKSLLIIVVLWSIFTAAGAFFGQILVLFLATRILLGISEGIHFPMMSTITRNWFPESERSRGNGLWVAGIFLATIGAPILLVPIIEKLGWRPMFYILSAAGVLVTFPLIWRYVYNSPETHPRISRKEMTHILSGRESEQIAPEISLKQLMLHRPFLLLFLAGVCNNMIGHGLLSWLPTYFTEGRGLSFGQLSYAMSLPYVFSLLGIGLWSVSGDRSNRRILLASGGFALAGVCSFLAIRAGNTAVTLVILSAAVFFMTAFITSEFAILQHIIPPESITRVTGLYNGLTMILGGGLGPIVVGHVVSATGNWNAGVFTLSFVGIIGAAAMGLLGRKVKY